MKNILQNCLYDPGTKVTVKNRTKHRAIAPDSVCFISRFAAVHKQAPNVMTSELVIVRNGKRGKDRAERIGVTTTIFPIEFERRPLKSVRFQGNPVVEIESIPMDVANLKEVSPIDFIGWAYAYKLFLRDVFAHANIQNKWPCGKEQPVNSFANISLRMAKTPYETIEFMSAPQFRKDFVEQLRSLEATIPQYVLRSRIDMARARLMALAYMMWSEEKGDKNLYDIKLLSDTYVQYRALTIAEQEGFFNSKLKRWGSLSEKKKALVKKPQRMSPPNTVHSLLKRIKLYLSKGKRPSFDDIVFSTQAENNKVAQVWFQPNEEVFSIEEV